MSQPFTEIKAGVRYAVVTVEWFYEDHDIACQQIVEHTGKLCLEKADFSCAVCDKQVCLLHDAISEKFNNRSICETCGDLTPAEREKVYQFRLELNQ